MKLWIDDERPAPEGFVHAKTSDAALVWLRAVAVWEEVSFDHDLGGDDNTRRIMLWMIEEDVWPREITIHTQNRVGRDWLVGMANRYAPKHVEISIIRW